MSVTASFEPGRVSSAPGGTAAFMLRLHNDAATDEVVRLRAAGELAKHTVLQSETIYLDPNETFDVPVIVDVTPALTAGPHSSTIEILAADGLPGVAEATIDVLEATGYVISMLPERSRSARAGRHRVTIKNTGNTPVLVELTPETIDEAVVIDVAAPVLTVPPGQTAKVELRVRPPAPFWSGPPRTWEFVVHALTSDGTIQDLPGSYEQGPRFRPWVVPALAGAGLALAVGALAWFTLLRPDVEEIAADAAEDAIFADREELRERIIELELAAAEAKELPLGEPTDQRLSVSPAAGSSATESFAVSAGRVLSVTDVVFQNPTGAVGTVTLLRDGEVLLESELANFRDLDLHFVAPFRFEGTSTVDLRVECSTPGPNQTECPVGATITGFVDQEP